MTKKKQARKVTTIRSTISVNECRKGSLRKRSEEKIVEGDNFLFISFCVVFKPKMKEERRNDIAACKQINLKSKVEH